jgi:hypothetical protein
MRLSGAAIGTYRPQYRPLSAISYLDANPLYAIYYLDAGMHLHWRMQHNIVEQDI